MLTLKHEATRCMYCGEFFEVCFSTQEKEVEKFLIGWRRYQNLKDKILNHKFNCEKAWRQNA